LLQLKELKDFRDGKLAPKRMEEIQQIILEHPFYFELIADLNRIEKSLPADEDIITHLASGKEVTRQRLVQRMTTALK